MGSSLCPPNTCLARDEQVEGGLEIIQILFSITFLAASYPVHLVLEFHGFIPDSELLKIMYTV
jgi:hypothetical protein